MEQQAVKLKAEVMWAFTNRVNEMSNKYQLDLCHLSDAACEALQKIGIEVREKEGLGKFITCKSVKPITVYDTDNDEINEDIGNGSKAKAVITAYEWKYKNKKGVSPSLKKIVITDLVEYAGGGGGASLKDDDEVL